MKAELAISSTKVTKFCIYDKMTKWTLNGPF